MLLPPVCGSGNIYNAVDLVHIIINGPWVAYSKNTLRILRHALLQGPTEAFAQGIAGKGVEDLLGHPAEATEAGAMTQAIDQRQLRSRLAVGLAGQWDLPDKGQHRQFNNFQRSI